jgi:hypothetical protein
LYEYRSLVTLDQARQKQRTNCSLSNVCQREGKLVSAPAEISAPLSEAAKLALMFEKADELRLGSQCYWRLAPQREPTHPLHSLDRNAEPQVWQDIDFGSQVLAAQCLPPPENPLQTTTRV